MALTSAERLPGEGCGVQQPAGQQEHALPDHDQAGTESAVCLCASSACLRLPGLIRRMCAAPRAICSSTESRSSVASSPSEACQRGAETRATAAAAERFQDSQYRRCTTDATLCRKLCFDS
eukprot:406995-Rhodomonas_salina.1